MFRLLASERPLSDLSKREAVKAVQGRLDKAVVAPRVEATASALLFGIKSIDYPEAASKKLPHAHVNARCTLKRFS